MTLRNYVCFTEITVTAKPARIPQRGMNEVMRFSLLHFLKPDVADVQLSGCLDLNADQPAFMELCGIVINED